MGQFAPLPPLGGPGDVNALQSNVVVALGDVVDVLNQ